MSLPWNSDLQIGIIELDAQQQELFDKFQLFSEAVENERGHLEIQGFLEYLDHYTDEHFKYEDHLQERSNFPGREEHLEAHRHFINQLEDFKDALTSGLDPREIAFAVKGMMIRWIITHNKHMDMTFNYFLQAAAEKTKPATKKLGEILVQSERVSADAVDQALSKQQEAGGRLGPILVEMAAIGEDDIKNALLEQEGASAFTEKLGHILVESGIISDETLDRALESQKLSGKLVGAVLVEMGAVALEDVMCAQAVQKGMLQKD